MILADTMVWAGHIGRTEPILSGLLDLRRVVMHPYVTGELALGNLPDRKRMLSSFAKLPQAVLADEIEVFGLIESARLFGTGVGYVDSHLIASTMLMPDCSIWTRDKRLLAVAERLGVAAPYP